MATRTIVAVLFSVLFVAYMLCLAPGWGAMTLFNTWDGLEYVLCATLLGIDHPPGHPIYLLMGKLFTMLPCGNPAWNINLISALFGAVAIALLYLTICEAIRPRCVGAACSCVALAASLTVASAYVFWSHCEIPEVHTLFLAVIGLSMYAVLRWHAAQTRVWLNVASLALAMGMGVNLLGIFAVFVPVAVFVIVSRRVRSIPSPLSVPILILLAGLLPYLYYPIRIARWPVFSHPMNYLCPYEIGGLDWYLWYISGRAWTGGQMFFLSRVAGNIPLYLRFAWKNLGPPLFIFSLVGIVASVIDIRGLLAGVRASTPSCGETPSGAREAAPERLILPFLLMLFIFSLIPEISIHDPSNPRAREYLMNFFLPSLYILAPLGACGALRAYFFLRARAGSASWTIVALLAGVPLYQCAANYGYCSLRGEQCAVVLSEKTLKQIPPGSVIISKLVYLLVDTYFSTIEPVISPGKVTLYDPEVVTRRVAKGGGGKDLFSRRHRAMLKEVERCLGNALPIFCAGDIVDEDKSPEKLLLADLDLMPWRPELAPDEYDLMFPRELYLYRAVGIRRASPVEQVPAGAQRGIANDGLFANGIALLGFRPAPSPRGVRTDALAVEFFWRARAPVRGDLYVGAIFLDALRGRVGEPCWHTLGGAYGASVWKQGVIVRETVSLFPPPLPPGRYYLAIGMVDERGEEVNYIPSDPKLAGRTFDYVLLFPFESGPQVPAELPR